MTGKKMPAVKRLHQQSESNTNPEYILGHSCQAMSILAQGLSGVVAFLYHFWMRDMTPITHKARDQYLHGKTAAYHRFIQLGLIAQGIPLTLATTVPEIVWASFGSWLRTIRPGIVPSESVTALALRNTLPHFLADSSPVPDLAKFIQQRLGLDQTQARRLAA